MADSLAKMEADLESCKDQFNHYKKFFTSPDSLGGTKLTGFEQGALSFIESAITKLEAKVKERKELLTKVTISDVKDHYSLLLKKINQFVLDDIDGVYLKWQSHILSVGTCYTNADTIFKKTVEAQNKYKADLANIVGSIISVAGIGTLSWLSTTGKLGKVLIKLTANQQNVFEDIAQGGWDKIVSYQAANWPATVKKDFSEPLVFQNKISKKALSGYQIVRTEVLKHAKATIECEAKMLELQTKKIGDAKKEFENYIKYEAGVGKIIASAKTWVAKIPPSINAAELTKDFERGFWAGWLPRLHTHQPARIEYSPDHGLGTVPRKVPASDSYDSWLDNELKDRLTALIDLKGIGVGEGGLWWTSSNDVKLLIKWAKAFKPTQKF